MLRLWKAMLPVLLVSVSPVQALAAPPADEILKKMDHKISGFRDQALKVTMTVTDENGRSRSYDFTMMQKGTDKRLIRFTSGEIKGMAMLVEGGNRVHVYLPGFRRVRKVASHAMNQTIAGSDFTNDDMAALSWSDRYTCKLAGEDATNWTLDCNARPGKKVTFAHVRLYVAKSDYNQSGVDYLDGSGKVVKTLRNSVPKDFGGVKTHSVVVMKDERTGHWTRLDVREFKVNQGLDDSLFTVRNLQWGR